MFCVNLTINSDYFPIQHWLTGFYNRDGVCLLRGTDSTTLFLDGPTMLANGRQCHGGLSPWKHGFSPRSAQLRLIVHKVALEEVFLGEKLNVKQSHCSPGHTMRAPGRWGSQNFQTIGTCRWQGCQPYAPAAFTPMKHPWNLFLLQAVSTPRFLQSTAAFTPSISCHQRSILIFSLTSLLTQGQMGQA